MDARLIENAADTQSGLFKDKGVYQLTPKGLHILERFITKNGISAEHLLKVFAAQPICMKLLHLERRAHDDELLINRPILEVIFRRLCGRQPNYLPGASKNASGASIQDGSPKASSAGARPSGTFDPTMGIGVYDIVDKVKGQKEPVRIKHVFPAISVLDWLVDYTTIGGRDEAAEVAAHFQRLGYISLAKDYSARREGEDDSTVIARGEDGIGRVSEGEFKCHYKCLYGLTDRGRATARWPGYALPQFDRVGTSTVDSRPSQSESGPPPHVVQQINASSSEVNLPQANSHLQQKPQQQAQSKNGSAHANKNANDIESLRSQSDSLAEDGSSRVQRNNSYSTRPSSEQPAVSAPAAPSKGVPPLPFKSPNHGAAEAVTANNFDPAAPNPPSPRNASRDAPFVPFQRPSAAEKLRNDYINRGGVAQNGDLAAANSRDSNTNRLKQILEEPALRSLFRDFLKQNFCEENLSFWLDVQDFKRRFHTTSSAVAVRTGDGGSGDNAGSGGRARMRRGLFNRASSNLNRSEVKAGSGDASGKKGSDGKTTQGVTAMEKHQSDLIAMAFVIYNTYLAQASPCELNIEHNLRMELVTYMNRVLKDAKASAGGESGVQTVRAKDLQANQDSSSSSARQGLFGGPGEDGGLAAALSGPPKTDGTTPTEGSGGGSTGSGVLFRRGGAPTQPSVEDRKSTVSASMPRHPLHASQLQTIVRLYERIQDHIFRLMATDSVPRFIKDSRFLGLVQSVGDYTEALQNGRLDPNDISGPAISQDVVDAMELGIIRGAAARSPKGGVATSATLSGKPGVTWSNDNSVSQRPTAVAAGGSSWES